MHCRYFRAGVVLGIHERLWTWMNIVGRRQLQIKDPVKLAEVRWSIPIPTLPKTAPAIAIAGGEFGYAIRIIRSMIAMRSWVWRR